MDWFHNLISRHDNDATAIKGLPITLPAIPEAGEGKDAAILHPDVVRNLITVDHLLLIEAISGYEFTNDKDRFPVCCPKKDPEEMFEDYELSDKVYDDDE